MASRPRIFREELEELCREYHHFQHEHERAHVKGSIRRDMLAQMLEIERRMEHLLAHGIADPAQREPWRAHFYHNGPLPASPGPFRAPLVFRGQSDAGTTVEIRECRAGHGWDVFVDDAFVGPLPRVGHASTFQHGGQVFREVFGASEAALNALRSHFDKPAGEPPWPHAPELIEDGLVDIDFSLQPRGQRALERIRKAA